MGEAKEIHVAPIDQRAAAQAVKRWHYSGKVANNSQVHFGVFLRGVLLGAMQFGPPLDRRKLLGLVRGTKWNEMLELNRMAFSDALPRNSESRALSIAFRLLRKHAPHVQWVVSFADGTQCGDGTIYRASGFVLTGIRKNTTIWARGAEVRTDLEMKNAHRCTPASLGGGGTSMRRWLDAGYRPLPGFQLRYVYFLDPSARERLTCPVLPFSRITEVGATMYKGSRAGSIASDAGGSQPSEGGAIPTPALHVITNTPGGA